MFLPVNLLKISEKPEQLLHQAIEKFDGMENMKQKIIWSMILISRYKIYLNTSVKWFLKIHALYSGISTYFSRMPSSNQIESSHVDYIIILVSISSQWIPLLKPENQVVFLLFKKICNVIKIVKCGQFSTHNNIH